MKNIIRLIYPTECPVCREKVPYRLSCGPLDDSDKIHAVCREKLPYINGPRCRKCSKEVYDETQEYCGDCMKKKHFYSQGVALFNHKSCVRDALYAVKYNNKREYLDFFAEEMVKENSAAIKSWNADMIVPVPLYRKKLISRGFNQAEEFAQRVGKHMNIPVRTDAVFRIKDTIPQKELTDIERKKNLENAFAAKADIVKSKKIIISDDIYTTGSTIDACAKVLTDAGAGEIYFITVTTGSGI